MKLKIVSDGTNKGTRVYAETGEMIEGVTGVHWMVDVEADCPIAMITFHNLPVELIGEMVN